MSQSELQLEVSNATVSDQSKEQYETLENYIDALEDKDGSLINVLHKAQELFGYLPQDVQLFIARKMDIPAAKVFGVVSFYSYFESNPVGKHKISVCMGTACFVTGAEKILEEFEKELLIENGETTKDGMFTLKDVRCIGACGLAPVVLFDDQIYGHVTVDGVREILEKYRKVDKYAY